MSSLLSLAKPYPSAATINLEPEPDPPPSNLIASPAQSSSSSGFLWRNLFADVESASFPSSSPTYLPNGTPVVLAPQSVILKASSNWSGHLLCRFLGEPPSPAKFFSDLNRVWGKHGDISVRRFSSGTFLVYVPSSSTRKWILQTGLWSSGTVSFVVSEWSVNPSLATPPKLTSATTVLTIREIPPQLWSHEAVARIAGGVAKLIPGTKASLPLSSLGTATIRAIVPLGSPLPPSVLVKDSYGASVLVSIDYGRLPHLCSKCKSYGHQAHRCPLNYSVGKPNSLVMESKTEANSEPGPSTDPIQVPVSNKESMDLDCDTSPSNAPHIQTDIQDQETPIQAMELDSKISDNTLSSSSPITHDSEVSAQVIEPESKDCEELVSVGIPSSSLIPESTPHSTNELQQVTSSSPQVCSEVSPVPSITREPLQSSCDSLDENQHISKVDTEYSSHQNSDSDASPASFSFPPLEVHALKQDSDHLTSSPSPEVLPTTHRTRKKIRAKGNMVENSDQCLEQQVSNGYLKCKPANHKFKPEGVLEKRRKRIQQELWPEAEELEEGIQEMQSDKKNTTFFEALRAIKIIQNSDYGTNEDLET